MILPAVIGHRGAAGLAPENTLAAVRAAAGAGLTMVEFDVRLTADGEPVVFHDDELERTSDGRGRVADLGLTQLRRLDAGSWFGAAFAGEGIPTLDEVLELCLELGLAVNIEIKPDTGREAETARIALGRAIRRWPADRPVPLVSSFAVAALETAVDVAPSWPRGLLVGAVPDDWSGLAERMKCATIHADHARLDAGRVAEIRQSGRRVLAYTVNDPVRAAGLWAMGVAAVFSDAPPFVMIS